MLFLSRDTFPFKILSSYYYDLNSCHSFGNVFKIHPQFLSPYFTRGPKTESELADKSTPGIVCQKKMTGGGGGEGSGTEGNWDYSKERKKEHFIILDASVL
jgi:hypothetical protein